MAQTSFRHLPPQQRAGLCHSLVMLRVIYWVCQDDEETRAIFSCFLDLSIQCLLYKKQDTLRRLSQPRNQVRMPRRSVWKLISTINEWPSPCWWLAGNAFSCAWLTQKLRAFHRKHEHRWQPRLESSGHGRSLWTPRPGHIIGTVGSGRVFNGIKQKYDTHRVILSCCWWQTVSFNCTQLCIFDQEWKHKPVRVWLEDSAASLNLYMNSNLKQGFGLWRERASAEPRKYVYLRAPCSTQI